MQKVTLGKTGFIVNKNGFGALPIQRISKEDAAYLMRKAFDNGITYFDWNVSSKDAVSPMRPAQEIVRNCTQNLENFDNAVILLHDAANKTSTVDALPEIIESIQAMENTEILPITEETVAIHH